MHHASMHRTASRGIQKGEYTDKRRNVANEARRPRPKRTRGKPQVTRAIQESQESSEKKYIINYKKKKKRL